MLQVHARLLDSTYLHCQPCRQLDQVGISWNAYHMQCRTRGVHAVFDDLHVLVQFCILVSDVYAQSLLGSQMIALECQQMALIRE